MIFTIGCMTIATAVGPLPGFNNDAAATRYAAFSVLDESYKGNVEALRVAVGEVAKHDGALFTGTAEWEHDINNGYSSVLYDRSDEFGLGAYRVYYSAGDKSFSGSIPGESSGSATLLATSKDGIAFTKPTLNRFVFKNSTANNILFDGTTALGFYDDAAHDKNASSRFKMWGNLPGLEKGQSSMLGGSYVAQLGGSAVSPNGLDWTDYRRLQNPSRAAQVKDTWRFDGLTSLFFDPRRDAYVGTMRAFRPCTECGQCPIWWSPYGGCQSHQGASCTAMQCNKTVRAIGTSTSAAGVPFAKTGWGLNVEVHSWADPAQQLYSQVSFPYYNGYLGIVMVFSAVDPPNTFGKGKVHCELAWSADGVQYDRIAPGVDFIPLGRYEEGTLNDFDSHICFASAHPVQVDGTVRVYYMGGNGPHYSEPYPSPNHRNSSFGLATIGPDRFVALRGPKDGSRAVARTVALAQGNGTRVMSITADTAVLGSEACMVTVAIVIDQGGGVEREAETCGNVTGKNVTDLVLPGCSQLLLKAGANVVVEITVQGGAALYTIGFLQQDGRELQ
jgi:hypothetical protein